jgi:hypothetical protein
VWQGDGGPLSNVARHGDGLVGQTSEGLHFWGHTDVVERVANRELASDAGMETVMSPTMTLFATSASQGVILCSYLVARAKRSAAHAYDVGRAGHQFRKGLRGNQWASRRRPPSYRRLGKDQHEDTGASKEPAQGGSFAEDLASYRLR